MILGVTLDWTGSCAGVFPRSSLRLCRAAALQSKLGLTCPDFTALSSISLIYVYLKTNKIKVTNWCLCLSDDKIVKWRLSFVMTLSIHKHNSIWGVTSREKHSTFHIIKIISPVKALTIILFQEVYCSVIFFIRNKNPARWESTRRTWSISWAAWNTPGGSSSMTTKGNLKTGGWKLNRLAAKFQKYIDDLNLMEFSTFYILPKRLNVLFVQS